MAMVRNFEVISKYKPNLSTQLNFSSQ